MDEIDGKVLVECIKGLNGLLYNTKKQNKIELV